VRVRLAALCLWVLTVDPIAAQTESASKVIERHIKAIGGKKVIEKNAVRSFVVAILITSMYVLVGQGRAARR